MDNLDMYTETQLYDHLESQKARIERLRALALGGRLSRASYDDAVAKRDAIAGELERRGLPEDRPQTELPF